MNQGSASYPSPQNAAACNPVEPDGTNGSMLAELQQLERSIRDISDRLEEHESRLSPVLLPQVGETEGKAQSVPEPLRSPLAERARDIVKRANYVAQRVTLLTNRISLT